MKRNFSNVLLTIAAMTTVSVGAVISAPLAKADTFKLTQISSPQPQSASQKASIATVVADTEAYSDPNTESNSVQDLSRGTRVVILDSVSSDDTTWYKVVGGYWGQGWIEEKYLSLIPQNQTSKLNPGSVVVVNSDAADARVFSGPGTNYIVRAFLAEGSEMLVLDSVTRGDATWYEIGAQNRVEGWINEDNLSLSSQSASNNAYTAN